MSDVNFTCSILGKRQLTLSPVDAGGNPEPLDPTVPVTLVVIPNDDGSTGPGSVQDDPGGGLPFMVRGGTVGAVTTFQVSGDPDPAPGEQTLLTATLQMTEVQPQATILGVGVAPEVPA